MRVWAATLRFCTKESTLVHTSCTGCAFTADLLRYTLRRRRNVMYVSIR